MRTYLDSRIWKISVSRKAVDGIHQIIENLTSITNGHLDTEVNVGGNREFQELSRRINTMVLSVQVTVGNGGKVFNDLVNAVNGFTAD